MDRWLDQCCKKQNVIFRAGLLLWYVFSPQCLSRFVQSAAIVAGHGTLWRIDPTGQFWSCQGAIVGRDSDRAEEEILTRLGERMANNNNNNSNATMDLETYLESIRCDEALELICACLQEVFWPSSLNLKLLPQGVQLHIPSIPWVATRVPHGTTKRATTTSQESSTQPLSSRPVIWRGAFVPPIPKYDATGGIPIDEATDGSSRSTSRHDGAAVAKESS